nr:MAG TPA: Peroxisomal biogenesis factor 19, farnesylation, post translational modification [Caudoviricetes sp.]
MKKELKLDPLSLSEGLKEIMEAQGSTIDEEDIIRFNRQYDVITRQWALYALTEKQANKQWKKLFELIQEKAREVNR